MKTIKLLILTSIYLFVINIYETNGLETNVPAQDNRAVTKTAETVNQLPVIEDKKDDSNKIQLKAEPRNGQLENRILKRKRKGRKPKQRKTKRKNKKSRKNRKGRNRKNKGSYDLVADVPLDSELPEMVDDLADEPLLDPLPLDVDVETALLESELITPLEDIPVVDPVDAAGDLAEFSKYYWDSETVEPEYVISEWFAILDGKKFTRELGTKFPYISQHEHDKSVSYLSNKQKNSRYLMNKYSSGAKYMGNDDNDTNDYVTRLSIRPEDLQEANDDGGDDEAQNGIMNQRVGPNVGSNYVPVGRITVSRPVVRRRVNRNRRPNGTRNRKRRGVGSGRTGIYDVQKAFENDVPVVPGTYRKFDEDEIERYGLTHNRVEPIPVDITADPIVDEPIMEELDDIDSLAEDTSYDVSDLDLDTPVEPLASLRAINEPVGRSITTERLEQNDDRGRSDLEERGGFDHILSNDYDEIGYRERPKGRRNKHSRLSNKQCNKELKKIKREYGRLVTQLREQGAE